MTIKRINVHSIHLYNERNPPMKPVLYDSIEYFIFIHKNISNYLPLIYFELAQLSISLRNVYDRCDLI